MGVDRNIFVRVHLAPRYEERAGHPGDPTEPAMARNADVDRMLIEAQFAVLWR